MTITPSQLQDWKRLAEAATRDWKLIGNHIWGSFVQAHPDDASFTMKFNIPICELFSHGDVYEPEAFVANGTLILEARTAVPALCEEVERLREDEAVKERNAAEKERDALREAAKLARETLQRNRRDVDNINADCVKQNRHPYTLMRKEIDGALAALDAALSDQLVPQPE